MNIATLFSGGEGVGVGSRQAGLDHLWGVEYDDQIASVGRMNGFNTLTGDVRDVDFMHSLPRPDVIHASPVCKNASNAKTDGEESPEDIASADATCAYIDHFRPDIFTLENVYRYRTFTAFAHIMECLNRNRYRFDYWHLNAADYGVPQTRQRLILVARLHGKPRRPVATHADPSKIAPLFDDRLPWIGWYKAIEDLIDTLPASQFAPWQLERLPEELKSFFLNPNRHSIEWSNSNDVIDIDEPMPVISSGNGLTHHRAFILDGQANDYGASITACTSDDPIFTMTGSMDRRSARTFIMDGTEMRGEGLILEGDSLSATVKAAHYKGIPKAFLVGDGDQWRPIVGDTESSPTVSANNGARAFIVEGSNGSHDDLSRLEDEPISVICGTDYKSARRAWLNNGRVVKMTPRALARFQSFPDSYILPDKARLSCTIIGNAVPPLLYQRVIEANRT